MTENRIYPIRCPDLLITERCNLACTYCFEKNKGVRDINKEKLDEWVSHNAYDSMFIFGGEPLLNIDALCGLIDIIRENHILTKRKKEVLLRRTRSIITNGTLIKQNLEKIKKYDLELQISIDGPGDANSERVFPTGKPALEKIMEGIQLCIDNDIKFSVHGVICKKTLKYFFETARWIFEIYKKTEGLKIALGHMGKNNFQIIFEEDYTDEDIDILIEQFNKTAEWIYSLDDLTPEQKDEFFINFFEKCGGVCGIGTGLLAFDTEMNMYPCHRLALIPDREKYQLGNAMDINTLKNVDFFNSFFMLKQKTYMYSAIHDNFRYKGADNKWFMWCPGTNYQTSGNIYYQSCKYNVMFAELQHVIKLLKVMYYTGKYKKKDNNRKGKSC